MLNVKVEYVHKGEYGDVHYDHLGMMSFAEAEAFVRLIQEAEVVMKEEDFNYKNYRIEMKERVMYITVEEE